MVALGYGKFVRADRVFALVPLEGAERRDGHRTYVHVEGLRARGGLALRAGDPGRRRAGAGGGRRPPAPPPAGVAGQESLL